MTKVKIYGAGSIGNHLAQASRRAGWEVTVVDSDPKALARMREDIYPKRYGAWDDSIQLLELGKEPKGGFDVIYLGTPPHVRLSLATQVLDEEPKVLQLEKPLCPPAMEGADEFLKKLQTAKTVAIIGYDHVLSRVTRAAEEVIKKNELGEPLSLDVEFRETWKGIFAAHPWLSGPQDTYLGFWQKGGGASGEHSHATNLWQHFAYLLGLGRVNEVSAVMQMVKDDKVDYDRACFMNFITDKGFVGRCVQDLQTDPVKKQVRVQFTGGFLEVGIGGWERGDVLRYAKNGQSVTEQKIEKTRPDDFYEEILHIQEILDGKLAGKDSPVSIERGFDTMRVIRAAHESRQEKRVVAVEKQNIGL